MTKREYPRHAFQRQATAICAPPIRTSHVLPPAPLFEFADGTGRAHRVIGTSPLPGHEIEGPKIRNTRRSIRLGLWGGTLALMGVALAFTAGCGFALIGPDRRRIDPPSRFQ
jgi:hypothetical protein